MSETLRKIDLMHKLFGRIPYRKCKDCQHLISCSTSHKWYKCECYGESPSEATDWRLKWDACGLIGVADFKKNHVPIVRTLRLYQAKKEEQQIEGQLKFH